MYSHKVVIMHFLHLPIWLNQVLVQQTVLQLVVDGTLAPVWQVDILMGILQFQYQMQEDILSSFRVVAMLILVDLLGWVVIEPCMLIVAVIPVLKM